MSVALVLGASRGLCLLVSWQLLGRGHTVHGCAGDARHAGSTSLP